jgi:thymidylate synthase (FAD)
MNQQTTQQQLKSLPVKAESASLPEIKVLDYGHVRLFESMGSDLSIVRNARVSYDAEWRSGADEGKDEKLIRYLLRNKHTSPFECVTFTFDIKCPLFVARQWHRHRTWSYNEVSARYTELPEEYYVPEEKDITTQSSSNKQMRTTEEHPDSECIRKAILTSCVESFDSYYELLEKGCPRELARGVLPMNTYTHFFGTVNLHNLFHFIKLRLHEHAQYEIRVYAQALLDLIRSVVPVSVAAFEELQLGKA